MPLLLQFLLGRRDAILRLAHDRRTLWIGAVFVLSAALAREYDRQDLLHEPYYLLIPFAASIITSFALWCLVRLAMARHAADATRQKPSYRQFLSLFWMTAPLAWAYAIPYERFLGASDAVAANLWTLGLVSLIRVILMIRIVSILTGCHPISAVFMVLLIANLILLAALGLSPRPVIHSMGGISMESRDFVLSIVTELAGALTILTLPVWLLGGIFILIIGGRTWLSPFPPATPAGARIGLVVTALIAVVTGICLLPEPQREQRLRREAEFLLQSSAPLAGLRLMSQRQELDFPPHWDPPPRIAYGDDPDRLLDAMDLICQSPPPEWVRAIYIAKLRSCLRDDVDWAFGWNETTDGLNRLARILTSLPEGPSLAREMLMHNDGPASSSEGAPFPAWREIKRMGELKQE